MKLLNHKDKLNIYIIDQDSNKSLGKTDIIPNINERLILSHTANWFTEKFTYSNDITKNKFEAIVQDVVYDLPDNLIFIYVNELEKDKTHLQDLTKINWNTKEL